MWLRETAQGRSVLARVSGVLTPRRMGTLFRGPRASHFISSRPVGHETTALAQFQLATFHELEGLPEIPDELTEWAIDDADLSVIKYRENAVFAVRHSGGRHALRLHRVGYHSNDELRSELQWMQALQRWAIMHLSTTRDLSP